MYPLCCIDIRNFLNQFYFFSNDDFPHTTAIDETLKNVWLVLLRFAISVMCVCVCVRANDTYRSRWMSSYPTEFARPSWSD